MTEGEQNHKFRSGLKLLSDEKVCKTTKKQQNKKMKHYVITEAWIEFDSLLICYLQHRYF